MACFEAERLRRQVMHCTNAYVEADNQRDVLNGYSGQPGVLADFAMKALAEARRNYWFHVDQHHCESFEKGQ